MTLSKYYFYKGQKRLCCKPAALKNGKVSIFCNAATLHFSEDCNYCSLRKLTKL